MGALRYSLAKPALAEPSPQSVAQYLFWLMFRNVASGGLVFDDPVNPGVLSQPGCILASPSWENSATQTSQDYVYNWTRDAAIVAVELAAGPLPTSQPLLDFVQFARTCQNAAAAINHFDRAAFLINGSPAGETGRRRGKGIGGQVRFPLVLVADDAEALLNRAQGFVGTAGGRRLEVGFAELWVQALENLPDGRAQAGHLI